MESILAKIADENVAKIVFHYTPNYEGVEEIARNLMKRQNWAFFVKSNGVYRFPCYVKHPTISEA